MQSDPGQHPGPSLADCGHPPAETPAPDVPTVLTKLSKWAAYPAMGEPVNPTLFIPCKTPLSEQVIESWTLAEPPLHPLTVPRLIKEQNSKGRTVGLILDLSNVSLNHRPCHAWVT